MICEDCDCFITEFVPTDRGNIPFGRVCSLDKDPEECKEDEEE